MATPGFIPCGPDEFHATIVRPGLEEVIEENGVKLRFNSAAAAIIHARRVLRPVKTAPVPMTLDEHRKWKLDKAEQLRLEREAFDMRNVQVVMKKRRR